MLNPEWGNLLEYKEGALYWKARQSGRCLAGSLAGCQGRDGYLRLCYKRRLYMLHRVIWEMHNGPIPAGMFIDHINGDRSDNRIENLRVVTRSINGRNRRMHSNNVSGVNGVSFHTRQGKWCAYLYLNRKRFHLGYFDNLEDAKQARLAAQQGHNFTDRHGL